MVVEVRRQNTLHECSCRRRCSHRRRRIRCRRPRLFPQCTGHRSRPRRPCIGLLPEGTPRLRRSAVPLRHTRRGYMHHCLFLSLRHRTPCRHRPWSRPSTDRPSLGRYLRFCTDPLGEGTRRHHTQAGMRCRHTFRRHRCHCQCCHRRRRKLFRQPHPPPRRNAPCPARRLQQLCTRQRPCR